MHVCYFWLGEKQASLETNNKTNKKIFISPLFVIFCLFAQNKPQNKRKSHTNNGLAWGSGFGGSFFGGAYLSFYEIELIVCMYGVLVKCKR